MNKNVKNGLPLVFTRAANDKQFKSTTKLINFILQMIVRKLSKHIGFKHHVKDALSVKQLLVNVIFFKVSNPSKKNTKLIKKL